MTKNPNKINPLVGELWKIKFDSVDYLVVLILGTTLMNDEYEVLMRSFLDPREFHSMMVSKKDFVEKIKSSLNCREFLYNLSEELKWL